MANPNIREEEVLTVHHWTDRLFTLTTTRDPGFRFKSGQFAMIGLEADGKPLLRAYSMASPHYADNLEFFSIKVENGPLTSKLKLVKPGDKILVGIKTSGTLVIDFLKPGKRVYLLSTGTGLAPFLSLIRDPDLYETFEQVILVHGCRQVAELAYRDMILKQLPADEFLGEAVKKQLIYYPLVTREPFEHMGRITDLMTSGKFFDELKLPRPTPAEDRFMICGSSGLLTDTCKILEGWGLTEGNSNNPGEFVLERAFVEK
jgi:ferredoxin--NADP+ reductase